MVKLTINRLPIKLGGVLGESLAEVLAKGSVLASFWTIRRA